MANVLYMFWLYACVVEQRVVLQSTYGTLDCQVARCVDKNSWIGRRIEITCHDSGPPPRRHKYLPFRAPMKPSDTDMPFFITIAVEKTPLDHTFIDAG